MFTRLFGGKAGAAERSARLARAANLLAPSAGKPSFAEAVPGQVMVAFHAHAEADGLTGNFLTAVTRGLSSSGQRELVLTLRLGDREQPIAKMQELLRFFTTVSSWAEAGNIVNEGGVTQFGERGLFGQAQCGLLYTDARAIVGVELPERALAAIFVRAPELQAALDYGVYRVLTRIGAQLRLFPFPTWGALDRPSVITSGESESSLAKVQRMRVPGASFVVSGKRVCLRLPAKANLAPALNSLPAAAPFALLMRPAPDADAVLTWRPGQRETTGISPGGTDGSRLSGCFMMFASNVGGDEARPLEDGYSLLLSSEPRTRLLSALREQIPLALALGTSQRLELEWE